MRFFKERPVSRYPYWSEYLEKRFPEVDAAFLVDLKNSVTQELGIEV